MSNNGWDAYARDHNLPLESPPDGPPDRTIASPTTFVGKEMQAYLDRAAAELGLPGAMFDGPANFGSRPDAAEQGKTP